MKAHILPVFPLQIGIVCGHGYTPSVFKVMNHQPVQRGDERLAFETNQGSTTYQNPCSHRRHFIFRLLDIELWTPDNNTNGQRPLIYFSVLESRVQWISCKASDGYKVPPAN